MCVWRLVEMSLRRGETLSTWRKACLYANLFITIPHGLDWDWTWTFAMRDWQLTSLAMARSTGSSGYNFV
jgi:hypothetical protein